MRCAKGFATGNGRAEGVLGTGGGGMDWDGALDEEDEGALEEPAEERGSGVASILSSSSKFSEDVGISSFGMGGIGGGNDDRPFSSDGKDAAGDGGGRTKASVSCAGDGAGGATMLVLNAGGGGDRGAS